MPRNQPILKKKKCYELETEKTEIKFHVFKFIDNVDHNKDHRIIFTKDMEEIYNCIPFDDFFYIKCFKINPSSLHPNGCEVNWSGNQLEITTNKTFTIHITTCTYVTMTINSLGILLK